MRCVLHGFAKLRLAMLEFVELVPPAHARVMHLHARTVLACALKRFVIPGFNACAGQGWRDDLPGKPHPHGFLADLRPAVPLRGRIR